VKSKKYSIFTISDSTYFLFTEVFLKSLDSKLDKDKINKVYICDLGHTQSEKDFINSFDKVELIQPIKKVDPSKSLWDDNWLKIVGSKTENLLNLFKQKDEPIIMIDIDSMFIKDFYDLLDFESDMQIAHRPFVAGLHYIASFVLFNKKETCISFIETWIRNQSRIWKLPKETKALCLTINELTIDNFKISNLPVEQIHFYDNEQYLEVNDTRIAHFKTWKKGMELGTKEDFKSRTFTRGYEERLKEYIDVSSYISE